MQKKKKNPIRSQEYTEACRATGSRSKPCTKLRFYRQTRDSFCSIRNPFLRSEIRTFQRAGKSGWPFEANANWDPGQCLTWSLSHTHTELMADTLSTYLTSSHVTASSAAASLHKQKASPHRTRLLEQMCTSNNQPCKCLSQPLRVQSGHKLLMAG